MNLCFPAIMKSDPKDLFILNCRLSVVDTLDIVVLCCSVGGVTQPG